MGLDSVELVMAFEEVFDISIPDATAAVMLTPRHATDWICNEVKATDDVGPCLSMVMFHQVRTELVASRGASRGSITLGTKMEKGWFAMRTVRDEVITRVGKKAARLARRSKQQWSRSEVREVVRQLLPSPRR